jgi:heparinase II/III-like protein
MSSLAWYLQRLTAMRPAEVPWRAWRMARNRLGGYCHWPAAEDMPLAAVWSGDCSRELLGSRKVEFPPIPDERSRAKWPADWRRATIAEAEDLLAHRASFFAFERQPLGDPIDWNRDYASEKRVPTGYAPALDYRNPDEVGDVKYIWELGRMQHLTRLAQAWSLTHDDRFAQEIVDQIADWIGQCPWMMGIHWTSPMEAGLRLISWTWAFHLIRQWPGLTDDFCRLIVRSVWQHLRFIDGNYSLFSSANNHLIAEASGAYLAAAYWSGLKGAARWKTRAKKHLVRQCQRQNHADGVNKEQAFGYQVFVWDLLLIPALMGTAGEDKFPARFKKGSGTVAATAGHRPKVGRVLRTTVPDPFLNLAGFPKSYFDRLERMAEFLAWVSDCRGNTPNVGDEDDGLAVNLGGDRRRPVLSLLDTAASVWQRDDFRRWAGNVPAEKTAWLLGTLNLSNQDHPEATAGEPARRVSRSFPEGGYHVLRHGADDEEVLIVFDTGPLGWPATAAHGHADALSLLLHLGGQPVFVDPGTFSYQDTPRRHYFRATAQHNTLCFGHHDQGEYVNRFLWGKRPEVEFLRADIGEELSLLETQVVWWNGARHSRQLTISPQAGRLRIRDIWDGPEPPAIRFCLAPSLSPELSGELCVIQTENALLTLENDSAPIEIEQAEISPRCYHRRPTHRVCIRPATAAGETVSILTWEFK